MRQSKAATAVKYTFKALGLILVFGTIGILLWRVFTAGNPKDMENLSINDTLVEAWNEAEAVGRELTIYTPVMPDGSQITSVLGKNYSYFAVTQHVFIEEANQVQVLFRYNNSTIRHLKEDYNLPEMPSRSDELYDVTLYVAYDLTPSDTTDNDGNHTESVRFERFHATDSVADKKNLYNYRRFTFDGIDMNNPDAPVLAVYLDVYYKEDIRYDEDSYGTIPLYDYAAERTPYKLSKDDKKNLMK